MKYLTKVVETYRVGSEAEVNALINEAKESSNLTSYNCVHKERKTKGEIVDEYFCVTLKKDICDEKEPDREVTLTYTKE